jgi:hypothetical protein
MIPCSLVTLISWRVSSCLYAIIFGRRESLTVPLELEATYEETCGILRIP